MTRSLFKQLMRKIAHSYLPSQNEPLYPAWHTHTAFPVDIMLHVPPFWQIVELQALTVIDVQFADQNVTFLFHFHGGWSDI